MRNELKKFLSEVQAIFRDFKAATLSRKLLRAFERAGLETDFFGAPLSRLDTHSIEFCFNGQDLSELGK